MMMSGRSCLLACLVFVGLLRGASLQWVMKPTRQPHPGWGSEPREPKPYPSRPGFNLPPKPNPSRPKLELKPKPNPPAAHEYELKPKPNPPAAHEYELKPKPNPPAAPVPEEDKPEPQPPADDDQPDQATPKYVTVDAAFGYRDGDHDYVYLLAGDSVQVLKDGVGQYVMDRAKLAVAEDATITAAFKKEGGKKDKTVFYGPEYGQVISKGKVTTRLKYRTLTEFGMEAPEAAALVDDDALYLFKGCRMMRRTRTGSKGFNSGVSSVKDVGLPCHVDAAFPDGRDVIVIKGNQMWRWGHDGQPATLLPDDAFTLTDGWVLKGNSEQEGGEAEDEQEVVDEDQDDEAETPPGEEEEEEEEEEDVEPPIPAAEDIVAVEPPTIEVVERVERPERPSAPGGPGHGTGMFVREPDGTWTKVSDYLVPRK